MSITTAQCTIEEYHLLVARGAWEDKSVELLQGKIIEISPEGPLHSNRIRKSAKAIRQQIGEDYEVSEAHPLTLSDSEPEPDIAIIKAGDYDRQHPGVEDTLLVIEFADNSLSKDLEKKRLVYAQAGILEYWVVDLRHRQINIYRTPCNGDYQSHQIITEGIITSLTSPQVSLPVKVLLGTG